MRKIIIYPLFTAMAAVISASSSSVFAQWIGPPVLVQQPLVDIVELNRFTAKSNNNLNNQDLSKNPKIKQNSSNISLIYQPSIERRRINLANFFKKSRAIGPTGAAEMEKLFASTGVIEMIAQ